MNLASNKPLESLNIFNGNGVQMRTFHITWLTFFVCFFGWFGLAPLMPAIRADLGLTKPQVGNTIIAAVSATILARLIIGRLCDTWGPRKTYTALLVLGSLPVMFVGLAHDYTTFLLFRHWGIVRNYAVPYVDDVCSQHQRDGQCGGWWLG